MTTDSNELREKGNQAFKQGQYQEAIDRYTEAIQLLANNQTDELTKCLSNRSQCYLNLNQYEEAIDDATRGLVYLFVCSCMILYYIKRSKVKYGIAEQLHIEIL